MRSQERLTRMLKILPGLAIVGLGVLLGASAHSAPIAEPGGAPGAKAKPFPAKRFLAKLRPNCAGKAKAAG